MKPVAPRFSELSAPEPRLEQLAAAYDSIVSQLEAGADAARREAALALWERQRSAVGTWYALTYLRFQQDTRDPQARAARERADALQPRCTELDLDVKRRLLSPPHRQALLEERGAAQAFALWERDAAAFQPGIQELLVREQELAARYVAAVGTARASVEGREQNLSELLGYQAHADRRLRHDGAAALWGWFAGARDMLDGLFDELVALRHLIAQRLGRRSFVEVGYDRKRRVDYGRREVEAFRREVIERVVPLGQQLAERQARSLGLDRLMAWDEKVHRPGGAPRPHGDAAWMSARAEEMFAALHPELLRFYRLMRKSALLDLESRDGKAVGGFCTWFPDYGLPFIFANFNGTPADVRVFTHEVGHAFQRWSSRGQPLSDYVGCTSESAEVHSMSLEFLCWPEMERFFGQDADAFRQQHLTEQLVFLPYGCAVDHFQHEVYEQPQLSPAERHALWQQLERTYMPWKDWGDLEHPAAGGYWQFQRHVYLFPFYYVDYSLAATCALQFWSRSRHDPRGAMEEYVALCRRGGSLPFGALVRSAGLRSPFEPGCLAEVVERAARALDLG